MSYPNPIVLIEKIAELQRKIKKLESENDESKANKQVEKTSTDKKLGEMLQ